MSHAALLLSLLSVVGIFYISAVSMRYLLSPLSQVRIAIGVLVAFCHSCVRPIIIGVDHGQDL